MNTTEPEPIQVLYVGEDSNIADHLQKEVDKECHAIDVTRVATGDEGLTRLDETDVDCVVSEYNLPSTDGVTVCETIKEDWPTLPFILFTGDGSEWIASEATAAGVTEYLPKEAGERQYERLENRIVDAVETRQRPSEQYRELFEQAPVMYAVTRNEGGEPVIEDCNERFCETLGYPREALVGDPLADHYSAESVADLLERGGYERALEAEFISEERQLVTRDGSIVETLLQAVPRVDQQGTIIGTLTLFVDITERKRAEEVLEQAEAMEAAMDGMAILDAEGRYVYVNEAHAEIYGYDEADAFLGESWRTCYDEDEIDAIEEEALSALDRDGQWRGEAVGSRRDGSRFPQELSLTTIESGGIICVVRDISERKEREHEIEAQNDTMAALHTVTTDLVSCRSVDEVCELTVDAAEETRSVVTV